MGTNIDIKIKAKTEGAAEIKKLERELSAFGKIESFKKLKKDVQESKTAWKSAQGEVARLAMQMRATDNPTQKLARSFETAKKQAGKLKTEFQKKQQALHKLRGSLHEAGVDTAKLGAEQKKLQQALTQTRKEMSKAAKINAARGILDIRPHKDIRREIKQTELAYKRLKQSGKLSATELYQAKIQLKNKISELKAETNGWVGALSRAKVGLAALAGAGFAVVKSFGGYSEFSQRMAEVNTLLDVSEKKFASISKEVLNLSTKIPQTASELAAAQYDIISAGVNLEKSTRSLELSAKAAVGGVTDTKTAVNVGIGVINAYGKSIDELESVYDILFQTVKSGVTTFPELAQHIGDVLPSARAADVEFKDVAASIAAMTKASIKTPQAATALKGAINAMAAPTPEAKKKFDELGITWKGLIPTLEAIRKKSLSVDQMRMLIPDVEARTGVLALTQNMDNLKQITDGMVHSAGSMQTAFDKMKDTPENQIKLFKNEISKLGIELGGMVSKIMLPAIKAIRWFKNSIDDADPVTQALVTTLGGAGTAFVLWKMGLSSIVLGLKGIIVQGRLAAVDLLQIAKSATFAGNAMKLALAGGAVYGALKIYEAVKAFREMRKAQKEAKESQEHLIEDCDRTIEKFKEFKDVKLPEDIMGKAPEELEKFRRGLLKARAYYVALKLKLRAKAEETTFFGKATDEAKKAQEELKEVDNRLDEIKKGLKQVGDVGKESLGKPAKAVIASKEALDEFEEKAKQAYENAKNEAAKYAKEAIAWEEKIKYARMSTEDKIRELGRKGMDEEQAWNDKRLQADEKLFAAKEALRQKDYKLAEKLAKDAESLYGDLAREVKKSEDGKDVVVKSIEDTKKIAIAGVKETGSFVEQVYNEQKKSAENARDEWTKTANGIKQQLDDLAQKREANIDIKLTNLTEAQKAINELIRKETKHIKIKVTGGGRTVEEKKTGGPILHASTGRFIRRPHGRLPGESKIDSVRVLARPGEWFINNEAGRYWNQFFGGKFMHGINNPLSDIGQKIRAVLLNGLPQKFNLGGVVLPKMQNSLISRLSIPQIPVQRFATGGPVAPSESITLRFQVGQQDIPFNVQGPTEVTRGLVKQLSAELRKMGLSHA